MVGAPGVNAVYVYVRNGFAWTEQQILSGAGNFGYSVAVDVDTLIVGAPHDNGDTGAAYIYYRTNDIWNLQGAIIPVDVAAGDRFGYAVDVEADRAVIGAPGQNSNTGAAYLYTFDGTVWSLFQKFFLGSSQTGDNFGNAVAISGDRIVIGAYLRDVSRTSGGNTTVYQDEGSAYVYAFKDGAWRLETIVEPLQASDGYSGDMMGYSVAISGTLIITGAPQLNGRIGGLATDGGGYIYITAISPPLSVTQPETVENILLGAKAGVFSDAAGFISPLYLFDTLSMVVDLSAGNDNDVITIGVEGVTAYGLAALVIKTGEGDDTLNILSDSVSLPTEGKVMPKDALLGMPEGVELTPSEANNLYVVLIPFFKFDGGLGTDTLNIPAADTDFTLTDTLLIDGNNSKLRLAGVEVATLIGGASVNTFTVINWHGEVTLDGMGGSDRYILSVGNITELHLTDSGTNPLDEDRMIALASNGADVIEVTGSVILINGKSLDYGGAAGIEVLTIGGLAGDDTITIGNIGIGEVTLDGGTGSDTYILNVADADANYYVLDAGTLGTDALILNGSDLADIFLVDETFVSVNAATIYYNDALEQFTLYALGGNDQININSHLPISTYYYGGEGNDRFNMDTVKPNGINLIDGQNGSDVYWIMHPENLIGPAVISDSGSAADTDYLLQAATEGNDNVTVTSGGVTGIITNPDAFLQFIGLEGMGLDLLGGDDIITITGVPSGYALAVYGGAGNDTMYVSNFSGLPNHQMLLLGGDGYSIMGIDNLILDASAGTSGTLTENTLTGFGLAQSIFYEAFANITLNLGDSADTLDIDSTNGATIVNANGGNDVVTINGTGAEGTLTLNLGDGSDTLTINSISIPATLNGDAGNDLFNINALETDQTISGGDGDDTFNIFDLGATLTVNGENGADAINVMDAADTLDNIASLTATTLEGIFNAGGSLIYNAIEALVLNFGSGADTLTITDTHAGSTTVNMNGGADIVNVDVISGATNINVNDDVVNVTANGVNAVLTVNGTGSADTLNVDDTTDMLDNTAVLTAISLEGIFGASGSLLYNTIETLNLNFGSGADTLDVTDTHANNTTVNMNSGADTVNINGTSATGVTAIYTGNGNDIFNITGSQTSDLFGEAGDDIFVFAIGAILNGVIDGGTGIDLLDYSVFTTPVIVDIAQHTATNTNGVFNIENVIGGSANDLFIVSGAQSGDLFGGAGDDEFRFSGGAALTGILDGGDGSDTLNLTACATGQNVTLTGLGSIDGFNGFATVVGGFRNINNLLGTSTADDTLTGWDANSDWQVDGASNSYTSDSRTITFSDFETLQGGNANDMFLVSGAQTNTLLGGAGDDVFTFDAGARLFGNLDGQGGYDTLDFSSYITALTITLTGLGSQDGFSGIDSTTSAPTAITGAFTNINYLIGSSDSINPDVLTGMDRDGVWEINEMNRYVVSPAAIDFTSFENIIGGAECDTFNIISGEWDMSLFGGAGDDNFLFNTDASITGSVSGDGGTDMIDFSSFVTDVNVNLETGVATNITGGIDGFEDVYGGTGNDTLIGDAQDNLLDGGEGDDWIYGGAGDDLLYPGSGSNFLFGGSGFDMAYIPRGAIYVLPLSDIEDLIFLSITPVDVTVLTQILSLRIISVESGEWAKLTCGSCSAIAFMLPNGNLVNFGIIPQSLASLTSLSEGSLPGKLDKGFTLISAMNIALTTNALTVFFAPHRLGLSFAIPNELRACKLAILFWDQTLNNGNGGWVEISSSRVEPWLADGVERMQAWIAQTGIYILVCVNQ